MEAAADRQKPSFEFSCPYPFCERLQNDIWYNIIMQNENIILQILPLSSAPLPFSPYQNEWPSPLKIISF